MSKNENKKRWIQGFVVFFCYFLCSFSFGMDLDSEVRNPLVNLKEIDSRIFVEMRYNSSWNFVGRPLDSYKANHCFLKLETAKAMKKAQEILVPQGLSLLVFDCYRPQRTVNQFKTWSKNLKDNKMKSIFYPKIQKNALFRLGYIASRSGHSRGETVDLTIVKGVPVVGAKANPGDSLRFQEDIDDCRKTFGRDLKRQLDMGTSYDCFSPLSHTHSTRVPVKAQKNRAILKRIMEEVGFKNYQKEWWHFTLKDESNKDIYYDFVIE